MTNPFKRDHNELVIMVLRFAIGAVFLWFGIDKWVHPSAWYGWIPPWMQTMLPVKLDTFLWCNGALEVSMGVLLVAGRLLRPAAVITALELFSIILIVGANEVTVRDSALLGCCIALFLHANAKSKRPVKTGAVSVICTLYVLFLFVEGILYLRSPV